MLTDAERLRDEGELAFRAHFYAEFSELDNGARFLAFLAALLGPTLFRADNSDTHLLLFGAIVLLGARLLLGRHDDIWLIFLC